MICKMREDEKTRSSESKDYVSVLCACPELLGGGFSSGASALKKEYPAYHPMKYRTAGGLRVNTRRGHTN
jgi:hypothetical protein